MVYISGRTSLSKHVNVKGTKKEGTRAHIAKQIWEGQTKNSKISSIESRNNTKRGKFAHVKVNKVKIRLQLDTACSISIINTNILGRIWELV